ncbi:MAG: C10 family peptidase, partial [Muribaculaceae bacterium]|nr:C10 family peptidase [Muribaculaceae bacterium]
LVGCVAVATAQAMSVQRYPDRPVGSKTYTCANYGRLSIDFDAEAPYNWDAILSGANNYDEAARIMYHAGMAVEMMYGTEGSGVYTSRLYIIKDALVNHFKYKDEDINYTQRSQYRGDWEQLMLGELQAGRAIVYNGVDSRQSAGHSFNVDGFDGKGLFHVNWGWGGASEGYFNLSVLNGGSYTFSDGQSAVYGISSPNKNLRTIALTDSEIESGLPSGSSISAVLVNGELAGSDFTIAIHGTKNNSGSYREIPFTYDNGMIRTTRELQANEGSFLVEVDATHIPSGETMTQGFTITVVGHLPLAEASSVAYSRAKSEFTIHSKHNTTCTITNASGVKVIDNQTMSPLPQISVSRNMLSKGGNTVTLTCGNETKTFVITIP